MSSNTEKHEPGLSGEFQENLNMLRQINAFSPLPLDTLKVFAYLCRRETFKAGELLLSQGEDDGQAFYIISGTARLSHATGSENLDVAQRGPGDFIGGLSLIGKMPRLFSLRAQTDVTCLVMARNKFAKAVEQFPEIVPKILHAMVERIYRWEKKFLDGHAANCSECMPRTGVSLL